MEETKKEGEGKEAKEGTVEIGKEGTAKEGKEGVTALAPRKNSKGQWLPGVSGNPAGRATRRAENAIVDAIRDRVSPEDIAEGIAWLMSPENHPDNAWRPIHAGLELALKYLVGPAPARTPESENVIDVILAKMRDARS